MNAVISETIFAELRNRIITGHLEPGEKLRQDHIAREFQTSHVPVREALLRLEAHGLARSEPRRGTRVSVLDPAEVAEVAEMRAALETMALRYAVDRAGVDDIRRADHARQLCDEARTMPEWELRNRAFHRVILAPCGLPRLMQTIDDLQTASARHLYASWRGRWVQRVDADHAAIVLALKRGDAQAAADVLCRHISRVR